MTPNLDFSYEALLASGCLGPSITCFITRSPYLGVINMAAGVASTVASHQVVKKTNDRNWSPQNTQLAILGVSLSIFAVTAVALVILGVSTGGVIALIAVGVSTSFVNSILFKGESPEAKKLRDDWSLAHEKLKQYETSCEEYKKISNVDYDLLPDQLKNSPLNKPENGSEFLQFVTENQENLDLNLTDAKRMAKEKRIDRKMERYFDLWNDSKPKGCLTYPDLNRKCQAASFYSDASEALLDLNLTKLKANIA